MTSRDPKWLEWVKRLQATAQNGLTFANDQFDIERYRAVREIAAEIAADHSGQDSGHIAGIFAGETGYATPKLDVRGVVFRDDAILLVLERADGLWTLPGGWVDIGESPREAAAREVMEESGCHARPIKLLALYDRNKHGHPPSPVHIYKMFILCELLGPGEHVPNLETEAAGFFREDDLPELSISRSTPDQIARMFEHRRHPDWPTDFD